MTNPSIHHQFINPMSIHYQSANPMSIHDQSANPSPIRQSITNPPIICQSITNSSIQCQSLTSLPMTHQLRIPICEVNKNPTAIHQSRTNITVLDQSIDNTTAKCQSPDTTCQSNAYPKLLPPIRQFKVNPPTQCHRNHIPSIKCPLHISVSLNHQNADWHQLALNRHALAQTAPIPRQLVDNVATIKGTSVL